MKGVLASRIKNINIPLMLICDMVKCLYSLLCCMRAGLVLGFSCVVDDVLRNVFVDC